MRAWRGTTFPILVLGGLAAGFIAMGAALLTQSAPGGDDRIVGAIFGALGLVAAVIDVFIAIVCSQVEKRTCPSNLASPRWARMKTS